MKLLVPIDFSPCSDTMLSQVESRAWPDGTDALVLHVVDVTVGAAGRIDLSPYIDQQTEDARKRVTAIAERLVSSGIRATADVVRGHPATAVPRYAKDWAADFVIVGSHGRSAVARFLVGSVSNSVVRKAPCSVEIVRARPEGQPAGNVMRILLATDGSDCSMAAARSIAGRPWPKGSEFKVVSFAETPPLSIEPWSWYAASSVFDDIRQEIEGVAEEAVVSATAILQQAGLSPTGSMLAGDPRMGILDEAARWRADLIVLGSHGRRGVDRILLGSVAESVAMHAHCSVEVIREPS